MRRIGFAATCAALAFLHGASLVLAQPAGFVELQRFPAAEAGQAAAVSEHHFYAISNSVIGKYDKQSGELVKRWTATEDLPLKHLNAGLVRDGKLYCSNSNYPGFPETSSVEIFDAETLEHVGTHSFGIYEGSLTWIDWRDDAWWAVFAHYSQKVNENPVAKPHDYTSLVKFDRRWRRLEGWVFPNEVLQRFSPHSCSGGGWGPDGKLYCSGHDHEELYRLRLPRAGSTLVLEQIVPAGLTGQGFAWDRGQPGVLYGIRRPTREVVVLKMPTETDESPEDPQRR